MSHVSLCAFLQNAGNQLKGLQKALKNPLGNAGVLAGELTKRAKRLHLTMLGESLCVHCMTDAVHCASSETETILFELLSYILKLTSRIFSSSLQEL